MMSYILSTVFVVLLPLLTPITGETQFKCQGETVILEFEEVEFHHETSTVNWYMKHNDGKIDLIAYKTDNNEPIVKDTPFAHNVEIDSDLNLVLRNVSSESNGEYLRRIVNGGIFNSSVNLYIMYAPSGKPIVSKEKSGSGKESFNLELPYLGEPEANVTIKPLKMNITNVAGTIQQYEMCLSGKSVQCLKESPCQDFTIRIGQTGISMQDVEKAPMNESDKTESRLETAMITFMVKIVTDVLIVWSTYIFIFISVYINNTLKNIMFNWQFRIGFFTTAFVIFVLSTIDVFVCGFVLKAVIGIGLNCISHLGLIFIVVLLVRRKTYMKSSAETSNDKKKKKQKTTLRTSATADAEKAGAIEAKETLLTTSEAGNPEETKGLDKTGQYDDIKPGCSHSV